MRVSKTSLQFQLPITIHKSLRQTFVGYALIAVIRAVCPSPYLCFKPSITTSVKHTYHSMVCTLQQNSSWMLSVKPPSPLLVFVRGSYVTRKLTHLHYHKHTALIHLSIVASINLFLVATFQYAISIARRPPRYRIPYAHTQKSVYKHLR